MTTISETRKIRVSKKSMAAFPSEVSEAIKTLADDYQIKSFSFKSVTADTKFYAGEGHRYTVITGENKSSVEMVAEHNFGASGVSYNIGSEFKVPVGSFVIRISYYTKFWMDVTNVQPNEIQ